MKAYHRSVMYADKNCELVRIEWEPGSSSAFHDHGESHGLITLLKGTLLERRREIGSTAMFTIKHKAGDVIKESPGTIHRMENPSRSMVAVSLHYYCPPLKMCEYTQGEVSAM